MRLILRQKEARGTRGKADFSAKKREITVSGLAKKRRNMCATREPFVSTERYTISSRSSEWPRPPTLSCQA
jgi:hypothetical protein